MNRIYPDPIIPPRMEYESVRLASFDRGVRPWPLSYITPRELAAAGWFYLGECDRVKCAFCKNSVDTWLPGDDAYEEHFIRFWRVCPFIKGESNNVPISSLSGEDSQEPIVSECVVCLESTKQVLFLPCRHVACCLSCSKALVDCPACRAKIFEKIKIFFP